MNPDSSHQVLIADIGGTNARFALADINQAMPLLEDTVQTYPVEQFPSLGDAAKHYLQETGTDVQRGVFAVAGRVDGDEARITNHAWVISLSRTRDMLGFDTLHLINDFVAQAMSVAMLRRQDVEIIGDVDWQPLGLDADRTYSVLGPGTGLGAGALLVRDGRCFSLPCEGGHVSFAPSNPQEIQILDILSRSFGRVSNERLLCGPGLVNIHHALGEIRGVDPGRPSPADITTRARQGDALCEHTLDVFCAALGAAAGDQVLMQGGWDGVFLTGGVTPRILDWIRRSGFRQRFESKGRFSSTLARVPTVAIMHPLPGLLGCAAYALDRDRHAKASS